MKVATMVQSLVAGAVAATAAVAVPAPAAATVVQESPLGTRSSHTRTEALGDAGRAAGLWVTYDIHAGIAGHILLVNHAPASGLRQSWTHLYTAPRGTECADTGRAGLDNRVWLSFSCVGNAGGDHLFVR
ncbi:hypothetical protein GCM10010123_06660 [Pilimelia anulata]|uniref:Secreted protein n=1 Tax=Pilimelia anulata TaxID=53371 RepID=A0A8J3F6B9_9ACTN|nr:hypothetical protein [Pilimelia anulata]GGJ79363.1 hypothetical protein GCM10010123_06660 [Pilimelia anulata]